MMDLGEILALVSLNAVIDSVLGLVIALIVVARVVRKQWTSWLRSKEADPYLDRVAEHVIAMLPPMPKVPSTEDFLRAIEPRLQGFEDRLAQPVEVDLAPIVQMVTQSVVPQIEEKVATIRSVIEGKIGWIRKVGKQTGEAIAEVAGNEALEEAGIDPGDADMMGSLENMLNDSEWTKAHPGAAFGLRLLKKQLGNSSEGVTLQRRGRTGRGLLRLRR